MQLGFSGHETFPLRYGWLKKGVDAVAQNRLFFSSERAMIDLGVGKNMVTAIKHWCLASGLIKAERSLETGRVEHFPTTLGQALVREAGFDPYLEDPATLWLLHWRLAENRVHCATWYWLFNLWHSVEFTKEQMLSELQKWLAQSGQKAVSDNLLKRDIDVCLRTYLPSRHSKGALAEDSFDCPLTELSLLAELADSAAYQFQRGPQTTLPNEVFLFALAEYWRHNNPTANSLALEKILHDAGSPGRIFKLDENSAVRRLEEISAMSNGAFVYGENGGLKVIFRRQETPGFAWLERYYQQR